MRSVIKRAPFVGTLAFQENRPTADTAKSHVSEEGCANCGTHNQ